MGTDYFSKKSAEKKYKLYKENEQQKEKNSFLFSGYYRDCEAVEKFKEFCSRYKFCDGDNIKVEVYEVFALRTEANYTIPDYEEEGRKARDVSYDGAIELVAKKSFYPYPSGTCGGENVYIYLFRGTAPGIFNINHDGRNIKVKVVKG